MVLDGGRLRAYLEAGATDDFSVPVRVRFQGGEADAEFRRLTEFELDEDDYWTYDEEEDRFEVGSTYAFIRSLGMADRVFLEVKPSESDRRALVFDLSDAERALLAGKLEENRERVDGEMRALGLGKYAEEPAYVNSDPLKMDLSEEALLALYDEYILSVARMTEAGVSPGLTEDDWEEINNQNDPVRNISPMINHIRSAYPDFIARLRPIVEDHGFESVKQWAEIGDRVQLANTFLALDERKPGFLGEILGKTAEEILQMEEENRLGIEALQAFSETEMDWFVRNHERFKAAIGE